MLGLVTLDQDFAGAFGATSAAGNLRHQLGHIFRAAEIGAEQRLIDAENADESHLRKVMPLGQHLRADQYSCLAVPSLLQTFFQHAFASRGVAVDADDFMIWKMLGK